jgi:hypothetical protein
MERTPGTVENHASARQSIREHIVCERDDVVSCRMNIAMHVADEMTNPRSLREVARVNHENVFVCRRDDVGRRRIVMEKLPRVKNRSGR